MRASTIVVIVAGSYIMWRLLNEDTPVVPIPGSPGAPGGFDPGSPAIDITNKTAPGGKPDGVILGGSGAPAPDDTVSPSLAGSDNHPRYGVSGSGPIPAQNMSGSAFYPGKGGIAPGPPRQRPPRYRGAANFNDYPGGTDPGPGTSGSDSGGDASSSSGDPRQQLKEL